MSECFVVNCGKNGSCLLYEYHVSSKMSCVSCLLYHVSCLLYPVSRLMSHVSLLKEILILKVPVIFWKWRLYGTCRHVLLFEIYKNAKSLHAPFCWGPALKARVKLWRSLQRLSTPRDKPLLAPALGQGTSPWWSPLSTPEVYCRGKLPESEVHGQTPCEACKIISPLWIPGRVNNFIIL